MARAGGPCREKDGSSWAAKRAAECEHDRADILGRLALQQNLRGKRVKEKRHRSSRHAAVSQMPRYGNVEDEKTRPHEEVAQAKALSQPLPRNKSKRGKRRQRKGRGGGTGSS